MNVIQIEEIKQAAASLLGDGQGNEIGLNPEYERGISELIARIDPQEDMPTSDRAAAILIQLTQLAKGEKITTAAAIRQALNDKSPVIKASETDTLPQNVVDNSETVYSLASLYSQYALDPAQAEEEIYIRLREVYGEEYC